MDDKKIEQNQVAIDVNLDTTPILYTDNIFMTTNSDGVVFDFGQKLGPTNKLRIVSRIGMSREHAKKFIKELGKLIVMTDGQIQTSK
ncbi:MAG: hypothetical protein WC741_04730 [Patescibacteria group bacterium]|jgi:hypothetical protein